MMLNISVPIVNAFVDAEQGGNPAGVVLHAERFDPATKQAIAAKVGLSETAFVSPSQVADFKLEFFTPTRQIAHCGHATIATFSYLVQQGLLAKTHSSKETIDGTRAIFIDGDMAFVITLSAQADSFLEAVPHQQQLLVQRMHIHVANDAFLLR